MSRQTYLRAAPVQLSILNGQTNEYQQVGRVAAIAARLKDALAIVIMGPNKQALAAIPVTQQTDWTIQNNIYCSFLDSVNRRMLARFDSADEARLFTAVALSAKLGQEPMCVMNSGRGPINTSDRFAVSYACWDLQQSKLERPIMQEERFEISPTDETLLKAIGPNGTIGSVFLVRYPNNVIAVVEALIDERALPSLPGASPTFPAMAESGDSPESPSAAVPQKRLSRKKQAEPPKVEAPAPPPPPEAPPPPPPFATVQPRPMYDSQLESIRNEMQTRFNELTQMIASLRRTQAVQNSVALTSDALVSSVQRLLKENQAKDQLIAEKQQLIDLLNERHTDTRERDAMRIQLAELGSKLSAQRHLTREKMDQQKQLNTQIEDLQAQIVKAKVDAESRLGILHAQLEADKQKQAEELDRARKRLQENVRTAEDAVTSIRGHFERALAENKGLKSQSTRDFSPELRQMKEALPGVVGNFLKRLFAGVYQTVQSSLDEQTDYDGQSVMKVVRTALQSHVDALTAELDGHDEEDEEDDE